MDSPKVNDTKPLKDITSSPTFKKGKWSGDFPSEILLGEIKPWNTLKAADGMAQLDHYKQGYSKFVDKLSKVNKGKTRPSITFGRLNVTLPAWLNFDNWECQKSNKVDSKPAHIHDRRLWVARIDPGVYLYTDFAKGSEDPTLFVKKPGIKVDTDEFADAVYDMQEALKIKADGILSDDTVIAFYDKNKKKQDIFYKEAVQANEERKKAEEERKKKEKEAKDKAATDKAAKEKADAAPSLPSSVKVINANQAIPDGVTYPFPKGVHFFIKDTYSNLKRTDNPRTYQVKSTPQFVTVDVFIDKTHEFRIEYVAVSSMKVFQLVVAAGSDFEWMLFLYLEDGVQVTTSRGVFSTKSWDWGLP